MLCCAARARSRLHDVALEGTMPPHPTPALVRLCGKLEALDRLLPKLKARGAYVMCCICGVARGGARDGRAAAARRRRGATACWCSVR